MKNPELQARARKNAAFALSGKALLDDMEQFRKEVTATPEAARAFLRKLGVLTKDGKRQDLIRD